MNFLEAWGIPIIGPLVALVVGFACGVRASRIVWKRRVQIALSRIDRNSATRFRNFF